MIRITEVVKHIIIINVIMFIAFHFMMSQYRETLFLYYPSFEGYTNFRPFQIITSMFMHADGNHLLFNMMSLFFLGPTVESFIGSKRFLILYLACGLAATGLYLLMAYFGVIERNFALMGASGAVVGISVAFAYLFPNVKLSLLFIPIPVKAVYLIGAFITVDLVLALGIVNFDTRIAHFAHLGGALCAFLLTMFWYGNNRPNISA